MAKDTDSVDAVPQIVDDLPEPTISGKPQGQDLGQAGDSAVTLEAIEKLVEKQFQSMKDTRLGKFDSRLDDLEGAVGKYEALQAQGMSKDQALSQMQGDKELGDMKTQLASLLEGKAPEASSGDGTQSWKERRASILSKAEIEGDDKRLIEFMKGEFSSYDDMNEKLVTKAEEWSFADETKPQPSSASIAQITPAVVPQSGAFDDFTSDAIGDKVLHLMKEYTKNKDEIELLNAELTRRDNIKE